MAFVLFGVVILAAGKSRRMGRPKLLLPWKATSIIGHLLTQWNELGASQIAVVSAPVLAELSDELQRFAFPNVQRILNSDPERGMFSSIQCAANWNEWNSDLTHCIVTLGDQPHLRLETLRKLIDFGRANPEKICQPMRNGKPKHPVLLPKFFFDKLKKTDAPDFKEFLANHSKDFVGFESDDAGLDFDMDTPEDYERAICEF
jgi:molybdenum cofactor cytidylyltransferase